MSRRSYAYGFAPIASHSRRPARARPEVLQEWQKLYGQYRDDRLSRNRSYIAIAAQYHCSPSTVRVWVEPRVRTQHTRRALTHYHKVFRFSAAYQEKLVGRDRFYQHVREHIADYVTQAAEQLEEPFSLGTLVDSLHTLTGIRMHGQSVERLCHRYAEKTGLELIEQLDTMPPTYKLAGGLRGR
jgi:hypothetical protein